MKRLTILIDTVLTHLNKLDARNVLALTAMIAVTAMGLYALYIVGLMTG